ncbi:fatty acid desaturase [Aliiroseovarius subalbicans]|uniref:fatty acid desaturase n=1 Tax=Aliiroseovarius subalbicans TaxID=2925840 RepID=UPI001F55B0F9|nr:fatty acid desaturase [Aliiroseovarius subalbicans]MCI2399658.1 fatty acid desaturase [Aliiroseovarius subalbicans]
MLAQGADASDRAVPFAPVKYLIFPALQLVALVTVGLGEAFLWISPVLFVVLAVICDWIPDRSHVTDLSSLDRWGAPILYVSAALQVGLVIGVLVLLGQTPLSLGTLVAAIATLGVFTGAAGGNLSHEFMHRLTWYDLTISRLLSALSLHSTITIDHMHTHHREATRRHDPASGTRGQDFWSFAVKSFWASNVNAAQAEATRLGRRGQLVISLRNRALRGHLFEALYLFTALALAGLPGLAAAFVGGVIGIFLIEGFNYVAHYGLMRSDTGPYEARHAWSSRRAISSGFAFNITQHSQHHLHPGWHFWEIEAQADHPRLPVGPSVLCAIAAIPPLWFWFMKPHLARWDRDFATEEELALLKQL